MFSLTYNKNSNTKHIVIWGGWYGSHNIGDQILLLTISDILGKTLGGNVHFTVPTDNPQNVAAYTKRYSKWDIQPLHNRRQFPEIVRAISSSDLFIFGGGVPFYEQPYHVTVMALLVGIARISGTPYMTWTVSSQTIKSRFAKSIFKWVLNGASALTYRDEHTRNLFMECAPKRPAKLAADSGFCLESQDDENIWELIYPAGKPTNPRPLVGLTPRTLYGRNRDAETHYQVKTPDQSRIEIEFFSRVVDWLWEHGFQPIFIPMNTFPPDDDRIVASQVIQTARFGEHALQIKHQVPAPLPPALYRECSFSVVARVHGSITSFIGNCPPLMYAFDLKHVGIMESMHLSQYCISEDAATPQNAIELLDKLASESTLIRGGMRTRLEELRQEALVPAKLVAQILGIQGLA
jgi:polysaccharide pyruvyl transferase WcaK-like protein